MTDFPEIERQRDDQLADKAGERVRRWIRMDMIEDMDLDIDEGGIILRLTGDFVATCESYLADDSDTSPTYNTLQFFVSRSVIEGFIRETGGMR